MARTGIFRRTKKAAPVAEVPEAPKPISLAVRHKAFQDTIDSLGALLTGILDVEDPVDHEVGRNVANMRILLDGRLKSEQRTAMLARDEVGGGKPKETTLEVALEGIAPFLSEEGYAYLMGDKNALKRPASEEPKT